MINRNLSQLLSTFSQNCQKIVQSIEKVPCEDDIIHFLHDQRQFQQTLQQPNKKIEHFQAKLSNYFSSDFNRFQYKSNALDNGNSSFACKQLSSPSHTSQNQTTRKITERINTNQQISIKTWSHLKQESLRKMRKYKPNPLLSDLFGNKHQDFHQYHSQQISDWQKQIFLDSLINLQLKDKDQQQKTRFQELEDQYCQQVSNSYKLNSILMAPYKKKLKRIKIDH